MKLALVLLCCLLLAGSVPYAEPDRTVVVWREERVGGEWWVPYSVGTQHGVAKCGTVEEARMLYSVLAAVMVGGER